MNKLLVTDLNAGLLAILGLWTFPLIVNPILAFVLRYTIFYSESSLSLALWCSNLSDRLQKRVVHLGLLDSVHGRAGIVGMSVQNGSEIRNEAQSFGRVHIYETGLPI